MNTTIARTLSNPKDGRTLVSSLTEAQVREYLDTRRDEFARSLVERRFWSPGQEYWAHKLAQDVQAAQAAQAAGGRAPAGRATVTGTVLSIKVLDRPGFHRWSPRVTVVKVLVDLGNGVKAYGNAPGDVSTERLNAGSTVTFTATFEAGNDPFFCFWKRPSKWTCVDDADDQAADDQAERAAEQELVDAERRAFQHGW